MYSTTIDAIADTLDTTIEQLCALKLQQRQDQQPVVEPPTPSSFSEGYPIHSPTHTSANPALAALLLRSGGDNSTSFDYGTLVGYDLDTTALLSLFPVPPRESTVLEEHGASCCPFPSSSSPLTSLHLSSLTSSSLSHSSDRDSTDSLLSTISSGSTASMSSVSTSCTAVSLSESDDGHDPTDDPHFCSPCSSESAVNKSVPSCNDGSKPAAAASEIEIKSTGGGNNLVKKSSSKRRRQKLSMKRHWEVPQQACVIPPIFDKRYFEDDRAEIPKSIKAMEEERVRARQEEEEETKKRRQLQLQQSMQQQQQQQQANDAATAGMARSGKDGSRRMKSILGSQQHTIVTHQTLASHRRPLSPSKSSGNSPTFPTRRSRRHLFQDDHHPLGRSGSPASSPTDSVASTTTISTTNTIKDSSASSLSSSPISPQPQSWESQERVFNNISSRVSAMEASMRAATRVLEQRAQWLERMDKPVCQGDDSDDEVDGVEVRGSIAPRRPGLPARSKTSPCLAGVEPAVLAPIPAIPSIGTPQNRLMVIEPPVRTSSMRTYKSVQSANSKDKPYPSTIPSWARRFEADEHQHATNNHHHNNNNLDDYGRFGLSNGDDEVLTRGDDEAAKRKRRWRRNTEDRHAEWMETIKAGRFGQDDPRGWGNRFQRLKQHFQTVTGRPMTPEAHWAAADDTTTTTSTTTTATSAATKSTKSTNPTTTLHHEEVQSYSKSDNEGSGGNISSLRLMGSRRIPKGSNPRHWFPNHSLRIAKDPSRADLPHLSKLW
ncbi:hypothetical protein DFQ27_003173 [Actinomortierella ambigua]|uniref:Uncharacterized protein n=1 Tax=Actinomortierella ambigua TaxID=1343610 RepID=A0A9P6Q5C5_9FUNG|nr:hypothetical protein DFQ27_003173 [Actinomortierella ambigua]